MRHLFYHTFRFELGESPGEGGGEHSSWFREPTGKWTSGAVAGNLVYRLEYSKRVGCKRGAYTLWGQ